LTSDDFDFNDEEEIEDAAIGDENEADNLSVDLSLPYVCDLSPKDHDTLWEIEREFLSDDSSIAPSELSLADFIILSESLSSQDDDNSAVVVSLPDSKEAEHNDDESSFSFVSRDSDESYASFSLVPSVSEVHSIDSETTRLSYSMAVKKGMNEDNCTATEAVAATSPMVLSPTHYVKKNRNTTKGNSHNDNNYIEEETTNLLESIYEGSKSCRGGRLSRQFKGNPKSLKSSSNHTRPNWSRKRRKSYRVVRHGQSLFDRQASSQKSSSGWCRIRGSWQIAESQGY